jgi:predicted nucleic acid-binding protein
LAGLVLDASVAVAAVLEEAHTEGARAILRHVAIVGAVVPNLWHLEVGQTLLVAERQGRLSVAEREAAQSLLLDLPVAVDTDTWARAMRDTIELASEQRLSLYDAAYLELSRRSDVPLATLDAKLRRAAAAIGVVLL